MKKKVVSAQKTWILLSGDWKRRVMHYMIPKKECSQLGMPATRQMVNLIFQPSLNY